MDELLGKYYKIIIEHFSKYLQDMDFKENKKTGKLLHQILYFKEDEVDSEEVIYQHAELLELKSNNNSIVTIICLIFELYMYYSEEVMDSIKHLKNKDLIDKKGRNYLLFIEKVLQIKYAKDDEAIEHFKQLLKIMPADYEMVRLLWISYYAERDDNTILEMVNIADKNDPFNDSIMHFKGFFLKEIDNYHEALLVYLSILDYNLKTNNSHHELAWNYLFIADCHLSLNSLQKAVDNVNESFKNLGEIEDDDLRVLLLNIRGEAYVLQNNIDLAKKDFNKTLKLDKENIQAKGFLDTIDSY